MEDLYYRFVERLRQDPSAFSRNKNYHAFEDPNLLRARRVHRRLAALEQDLLRADPGGISVESHPKGVIVSVALSSMRSKSVAFLDHQEYSLLLTNPSLTGLLPSASK